MARLPSAAVAMVAVNPGMSTNSVEVVSTSGPLGAAVTTRALFCAQAVSGQAEINTPRRAEITRRQLLLLGLPQEWSSI
jgi:hypothetical protein